MEYSDSAKVCLYNYFRDFGYVDGLDNVKKIVDLDNCNNKDEFVDKLKSIKLDVTITEIPLTQISAYKNIPYFAVCKIENNTIFLPVYLIDNECVLIKDSKGNKIRIKNYYFEQIYQGEIIEIVNNNNFLKKYIFKDDYKKSRIYFVSFLMTSVLLVPFLVLLIISTSGKVMFDSTFEIIIWLGFFITIILFIIFALMLSNHQRRLDLRIKGQNKSTDDYEQLGISTILSSPKGHKMIIDFIAEIIKRL